MDKVFSVRSARGAFTLVELAVVIVIVGVLAAFGVPRFIKSVERSKAAEAFTLPRRRPLGPGAIRGPGGGVCDRPRGDRRRGRAPRFFTVPKTIDSDGPRDSWSLTLTRAGASRSYGAYTVTFTQDGYDPAHSTIDGMAEIQPARRPPAAVRGLGRPWAVRDARTSTHPNDRAGRTRAVGPPVADLAPPTAPGPADADEARERPARPYLVDRVSWRVFAVAALLLVLTLVDGLMTVVLLDHGFEEATPS